MREQDSASTCCSWDQGSLNGTHSRDDEQASVYTWQGCRLACPATSVRAGAAADLCPMNNGPLPAGQRAMACSGLRDTVLPTRLQRRLAEVKAGAVKAVLPCFEAAVERAQSHTRCLSDPCTIPCKPRTPVQHHGAPWSAGSLWTRLKLCRSYSRRHLKFRCQREGST